MTLWGRTRTEVAGAWRSLRYDLGRRETEAGGTTAGVRPPAYEDVTSTGLHTFGGAGLTGGLDTSYGPAYARRPRRAVAVTAFGTLAVAGAAGSYFAVVNGLGALLDDQPAGAEPYPLAAAAPGDSPAEASNEGLGQGSAPAPGPLNASTAPGTIRTVPHDLATTGTPAARDALPVPRRTTVNRTPPATEAPSCCLAPPVPTPTAAPSTPHSPSPTPSPSVPDDEPPPPEPTEDPTSTDPGDSGGSGGAGSGDRTERAARAARS